MTVLLFLPNEPAFENKCQIYSRLFTKTSVCDDTCQKQLVTYVEYEKYDPVKL